jgi:hypothetical protein
VNYPALLALSRHVLLSLIVAVLVAILAQDAVEMGEFIKMAALASLVTLLVVFPLQIGLFLLLY